MVRKRVQWTDAEWEQVAETVYHTRLSDPGPNLLTLINRAVSTLPKARQRKVLTVTNAQPLLALLEEKYKALKACEREIQSCRDRMEHLNGQYKDPEQIMAELSDQEVWNRFGDRIMNFVPQEDLLAQIDPELLLETIETPELASEAVRRLVEEYLRPTDTPQPQSTPEPMHKAIISKTTAAPVVPRNRMSKVVIVGCLPNQQRILKESLKTVCDVQFAGKDQSVPSGGDLYVCWVRFCSHATEKQCQIMAPVGRFLRHSGGLTKMASKIQKLMASPQEA